MADEPLGRAIAPVESLGSANKPRVVSRRGLLGAAPVAAVAFAMPAAALAVPSSDAQIVAAWERRVAAFHTYNGSPMHDEGAEKMFWPLVDQCDKFIQQATATTPRGAEIQIWLGLHNSAAWSKNDEAAMLARDLDYLIKHEKTFDWDVLPMIGAIRSLRAMGSR